MIGVEESSPILWCGVDGRFWGDFGCFRHFSVGFKNTGSSCFAILASKDTCNTHSVMRLQSVGASNPSVCEDIETDRPNFHQSDTTIASKGGHIGFKSSQYNLLDESVVLRMFSLLN